MKKYISLVIIIFVVLLIGCSSKIVNQGGTTSADPGSKESGGGGWFSYEEGGSRSDDDSPYAYDSAFSGASSSGGDISGEDGAINTKIPAGQLTASATMDNQKYDFWHSLVTSNQEGAGIFQSYDKDFAFKSANRIALSFPKGTSAKVTLINDDNVEFVGLTDANGMCYVFAKEERNSYKLKIDYLDKDGNLVTIEDEVSGDKAYNLEVTEVSSDLIEIMFVIDATGSMGDEIKYLQAEITDVIKKVKEANNNVRILLSIMMYRDQNDEYITLYNDFTEDINAQLEFLNAQSAQGGGDFPEAVEVAFAKAAAQQWTSGTSTKILVHVADAPAHNKDVASWAGTVDKFASLGVRILTIASSGIDKQTEYFFRCQSILTNGVYVHLTNDSGIGGDHIGATTEEKEEVELLNDCLVRLINGFHTGDFGEAIYWRQSQSTPLS